ncbi:Outer membrane protein beta-barrel domain-containing protein [Flavobacterium fluvii]|uniref:Outer membrane protein beta-barrel domain-containing protein n=1 Tax=Flavobacterium fluvii TaxID=468056 RepID=A0A1M5MWR1_9FLAO|nr:outer membrane beta-barrel protein [Flavobacterium fluvii]SHG81766.1 Outer membrane protein beta-barrel domain-containing protein [Flavobacterium fluvii]
MKLNNQIAKGLIVVIFALFGIVQTQAQVTFKPGLRGGANFSHFTKGDYYYSNNNNIDYDTHTDFYLGFYGALKLSKYYTLQPEIDYSAQGSNYSSNIESRNYNVDYLQLGVVNKFTFNDQFNIHLGPTLDFVVSQNFNTEADVDMAFVLGAGFNFTPNFGIEARVKKGIIPVRYNDLTDSYHTNVVFSLGATYTFDLK